MKFPVCQLKMAKKREMLAASLDNAKKGGRNHNAAPAIGQGKAVNPRKNPSTSPRREPMLLKTTILMKSRDES